MFISKKLSGVSESTAEIPVIDGRMFINDRSTYIKYLVDTGAAISVIPNNMFNKETTKNYRPPYTLYAANGNLINTYGTKIVELDFGFKRKFIWNFIVADVNKPILGSDFLLHYNLLPDLKNCKLVDGKTLHCISGIFTSEPSENLYMIQRNNEYNKLLEEFPQLYSITRIREVSSDSKVFHHIETKGPPINSKVRRLDPKRLDIAQKEFQYLLEN